MKFWKTFIACLLAIMVSGALLWFGFLAILSGAIMMIEPAPTSEVKPSSVLQLNFGRVNDSPVVSPFENININTWELIPSQSTLQVIEAISAATVDDNIKGIYICLGEYSSISAAGIEEVRAALQEFKSTGKMIIAYQDSYSQFGYWLASVADKVFLNPQGGLDWVGTCSEVMFFKGLLDKLDVEPQIFRHGTFKAAVEPYMTDKMSDANRAQLQQINNSVWGVITNDVAVSRGLTTSYLNQIANNLSINTASDALEYGLVDALMYESEVVDFMARVIEDPQLLSEQQTAEITPEQEVEMTIPSVEKSPMIVETKVVSDLKTVNIVNFSDYVLFQTLAPQKSSQNKIAVIYAEGQIVSGEGYNALGDKYLHRLVRKAAEDDDVKAVVLRVNSPGGSALAAEQMWYELERLRQEKPLIVSMGAYAASGGYYIAAPADAILADKMTITGSIGVFGVSFNMGDALKNKLGVTVDVVETNEHSNIGMPFHSMDKAEQQFFQNSVDNVYNTFVSRVAAGRNMSFESVDAVAEGRIWSGVDARQIGLVDDLGGLAVAINIAADRAGVASDFQIVEILDEVGIAQLFSSVKASVRERVMRQEMGVLYDTWKQMQELQSKSGIRAEMPYSINIR